MSLPYFSLIDYKQIYTSGSIRLGLVDFNYSNIILQLWRGRKYCTYKDIVIVTVWCISLIN